MPQLRQNVITGEWVVIAPERSKRPSDFISAETVKTETTINCPFCMTGPAYQKSRLRDFENESIYVLKNKYPAFLEDETQNSARAYRLEDGFYNTRPATGGHDVLVVKEHEQLIYTFTNDIWVNLFEMANKRYMYWRHDRNVQYSMLIYNNGVKAGASISHPHAQIFSSNIIPNHISKEIAGSEKYFEDTGGCVFCDLINHENFHKSRIIAENDSFIAFTFYAARFPFEVWVMPKTHLAHFEEEKPAIIKQLAEIMQSVMKQLGKTLQNPPLNFWLHDLPTTIDRADYFHWHIEIAPRVSTYGGFELGSGTVIDVIAPEDAANYLRAHRG